MNRKRFVSVFLCLLMVVSTLSYGSQMVLAEETMPAAADEVVEAASGATATVTEGETLVTDVQDTASAAVNERGSLPAEEMVSGPDNAGTVYAEDTAGAYSDVNVNEEAEIQADDMDLTGSDVEMPEESEEPEEDLISDAEETEPDEGLRQDDPRIKVKQIIAKSDFVMIPKFGEKIFEASFFDVDDGLGGKSGVKFTAGSGNCDWIRLKDGGDESAYDYINWEQKFAGQGQFTPGKWRVSCKIRIDGENAKQYTFAEEGVLKVRINDEWWDVKYVSAEPEYSYAVLWSPIITVTQPAGFYFLDDAGYDIGRSVVGEPIQEFSVAGSVYKSSSIEYHFSSPGAEGLEWLDVKEDGTVYGTPDKATPPGTGIIEFPIWCVPHSGSYSIQTIMISVDPTRARVTSVKATSNTKSVAVRGKKVQTPAFTITEGSPAYIGQMQWQKKQADGIWAPVADGSGNFTAGEWRMAGQILIGNYPGDHDKWKDTNYYVLKAPFTFQVDGETWTTSKQPYKVIEGNQDTIANVISPVIKIAPEKIPSVSYRTHVQKIGWQDYVKDGAMSGTEGKSLRLEGIKINISNLPYPGGIDYRTHVQTYGWQGWKSDDEMAGTSGEAKRLEAIQIRLAGEIANYYDVYYQTHIQKFGWSGWAKNGEMCGSAGYAYRLEGIRIKLVKKGEAAPGSTANTFHQKSGSSSADVSKVSGALVGYNTHVQTYGWQSYAYDGDMAGTSGQSKRLEGIHIALVNKPYTGNIVYRTHVQTYGWQSWKKNGEMSGTSGESKRLEGIQIYLEGEMAKHYDVYYCVHAQTYGWLDWAKNGIMAGTSGLSRRLEGIKIVLVPKGGAAPGATAKPYVMGSGGKLPDNPYTGS